LKRHLVASQVNPLIFLELVGQKIDKPQVKILTSQVGITVGCLDFKNPFPDLKNGNVERPAAQIEDGNLLFAFFIQAIGQ
jgi:hypothetical protein